MSAQVVGICGRKSFEPVESDVVGSTLVSRRIDGEARNEELVRDRHRVNQKCKITPRFWVALLIRKNNRFNSKHFFNDISVLFLFLILIRNVMSQN